MRKRAPFIDNINRWFEKAEKLVIIKKLNFLAQGTALSAVWVWNQMD